jgi:hypothetical protein
MFVVVIQSLWKQTTAKQNYAIGTPFRPQSAPFPTTSLMFRPAIAKTSLKRLTPRTGGINLQPVLCRPYHEKVISHYENPRNVGHLLLLVAII